MLGQVPRDDNVIAFVEQCIDGVLGLDGLIR